MINNREQTKAKFNKILDGMEDVFPTVDVEDFLIHKGVECTRKGEWLKMRCLLPGHDDNNPSFFVHRVHGGWNCYVCGSGSWNELLNELGWAENKDEIIVGITPMALIKDFQRNMKDMLSNKEDREQVFPKPDGLSEINNFNIIHCYNHHKYLKNRNLSKLTSVYKVYYTEEDYLAYNKKYKNIYKNRIIIPVENEVGKIIWYEGRLISEAKTKWKYWRPPGVKKENYLFNMHRVIGKGYKWIIVVEGIIDAMLLWSWGMPGVCCFGANISDDQMVQLLNFNKIYLCFDNDTAGIKGYLNSRDRLKLAGADIYRILLPRNRDVNDVGQEFFIKSFHKAKKS